MGSVDFSLKFLLCFYFLSSGWSGMYYDSGHNELSMIGWIIGQSCHRHYLNYICLCYGEKGGKNNFKLF